MQNKVNSKTTQKHNQLQIQAQIGSSVDGRQFMTKNEFNRHNQLADSARVRLTTAQAVVDDVSQFRVNKGGQNSNALKLPEIVQSASQERMLTMLEKPSGKRISACANAE